MAHFVEIDENNVVLQVLVVPDREQHRGQDFLANELGFGGRWIQTSYNNTIRKRYAGIGFIYDEELDIFLYPKPFPSWILNKTLGEWNAPVSRPNDYLNKTFIWNEQTLSWDEIEVNLP
jgi:hypothetical protein